ncbi:MAG: hypothetical protein QOH57_4281 [Mycobacterium sp.]|jgi:GNAT superfamily N-acetyltransferase|nr:hypothetical protein [Mycobacterium sp.]
MTTDQLESRALEILYFEVSDRCRRQGIGTKIVRELEARHSDRTLVAFSQDADDFWGSVGWQRYAHPTDPLYQTLFVQRERGH